ncbi:MAG: DUF1573 domain-containing protein [Massilibacteroides sp.]|nr:DUF1573 domain-containing protein [Massilibacteroides sp.]
MKQFFLSCAVILFSSISLHSQEKPKVAVREPNCNLGLIKEDGGAVEHTFVIENVGAVPLVVDRITTSCGCTLPEWSKEPVSPGKTKEIKVWYDPEGRPGPFYKTISVYSNAEPRRFVLSIKGEVERKILTSATIYYPYSVGALKVFSKTVSFPTIRMGEMLGEKIAVKNGGEKLLTIRVGELPAFITAELRPSTLQPGETGEIVFMLDAKGIGRKGRYHATVPLKVQMTDTVTVSETIRLDANVIDDFSNLSSTGKEKAPAVQMLSTRLDFGKVVDKGAILGFGGKVSQTLEIHNNGKSPLLIYSISSDDERIDVGGGKKEIKPNSSAHFKISIRPKDIKTKLESTVVLVCNDPNGPVRLIKITAEK